MINKGSKKFPKYFFTNLANLANLQIKNEMVLVLLKLLIQLKKRNVPDKLRQDKIFFTNMCTLIFGSQALASLSVKLDKI